MVEETTHTLIPPEHVLMHSESGTKRALIMEMLELLPAIDPDIALEVVMAREQLGSTGIGHGVAIPHGRLPELSEPVIALARHVDSVDFDAIDGRGVNIVVLLLAPEGENRAHLELLAKLARVLQRPDTREAILDAERPGEISALFADDGARMVA